MIYGNYLRNKYNNAAVKLADAEGVPCIMEYSKGKNMRNYEIYGNSVQDGTPSPGNPIEIQSVGDLTTNLFDVNAITSTAGGYIENDTIYVTSYPYNTGITPEKFLEMTGLQKGDTFTTDCEYTQLSDATSLWGSVTFLSKTSGYSNIDLLLRGKNKTSTIPEGFNSTNYNKMYIYSGNTAPEEGDIKGILRNFAVYKGTYTADTMPEYEPYHKYKIPIKVYGKNLLPNSDWMSGAHQNGFNEKADVDYITEYTQNSISFNLTAWTGVSSPRFRKDSVKRIVFKVNQDAFDSDSYANFYITIQAYDDNNTKTGNRLIYSNVVADTEYVFDFSTITDSWLAETTQFSFCILARKNALSNLMVYDIAYYADTDTTDYEPYHEPVTTHIYLDEPLRKVGDYADYIYFKNQKVMRNVIKQSLNAHSVYKKLNSVIRIDGYLAGSIKHKRDYHILSTIFNYNSGWTADVECIFHHSDTNLNYYWSIYWNRLGLTYDGTNVYRTDDTSQTPLTDSEIISIANQWLSTLPDKDKEIYMILDTPTEESVSLPTLKTFKGTSIMSVNTSIQPSNIKTKYVIS